MNQKKAIFLFIFKIKVVLHVYSLPSVLDLDKFANSNSVSDDRTCEVCTIDDTFVRLQFYRVAAQQINFQRFESALFSAHSRFSKFFLSSPILRLAPTTITTTTTLLPWLSTSTKTTTIIIATTSSFRTCSKHHVLH